MKFHPKHVLETLKCVHFIKYYFPPAGFTTFSFKKSTHCLTAIKLSPQGNLVIPSLWVKFQILQSDWWIQHVGGNRESISVSCKNLNNKNNLWSAR